MDLQEAIVIPRGSRRWSDRSIVRLMIFGFVLAGSTIAATILTRLLVPAAPSPFHRLVLVKNFLLPLLLIAAYALTVKKLEGRRPVELALHPGIKLLAAGLIAGTAIISAFIVVMFMAGAAHTTDSTVAADLPTLANEFLVPWLTAVGEELLFRAVLFRIAEEMFGTAVAVVISAALFGLSHAANPGAHPAALLALALGMGVLLALSFAATRNLWFPIGIHMGWNSAEGYIYGLPNSGMTDPASLLPMAVAGHPVLSGGSFGPEGSVILLILSLKLSVLLLTMALRTNRWRPVQFQMR